MPNEYNIQTIFEYLEKDFSTAWDCIVNADIPDGSGHGNYMFGLMTTILIEWLGRLYSGNDNKLKKFSETLNEIDSRYFIEIPDYCPDKPGFNYLFLDKNKKRKYLINHIFDLVRNGIAHQYNQIEATLSDNAIFTIALTGAARTKSNDLKTLQYIKNNRSNIKHFECHVGSNKIELIIDPGCLFLDLMKAVNNSDITDRNLFNKLTRRKYDFSQIILVQCLKEGRCKFIE